LYVENEPMVYTAYRSSSMSEEEKQGADHMFEMMMASKQQLLLRKAMQVGALHVKDTDPKKAEMFVEALEVSEKA